MIAAHIGLNRDTVSRALSNHPRVSAATRELVQRAARELGYWPPDVTTVEANGVPDTHPNARRATIAAITDHPADHEPIHVRALRRGAERAAEVLGYRFETFRAHVRERRYASLERSLRTAEVQSLLLLPSTNSVQITKYLDWSCFSVVTAAPDLFGPYFHQVGPDQLRNTRILVERLAARGGRHFGYVTSLTSVRTADRHLSATLAWLNAPHSASALSFSCYTGTSGAGLREWVDRQQLDVIIVDTEQDADGILAQLGERQGRRVSIVLNEHTGTTRYAGINPRYEAIGYAALQQLHVRIQSGEKGVPEIPTMTTLQGSWVEADTAEIACDVAMAS